MLNQRSESHDNQHAAARSSFGLSSKSENERRPHETPLKHQKQKATKSLGRYSCIPNPHSSKESWRSSGRAGWPSHHESAPTSPLSSVPRSCSWLPSDNGTPNLQLTDSGFMQTPSTHGRWPCSRKSERIDYSDHRRGIGCMMVCEEQSTRSEGSVRRRTSDLAASRGRWCVRESRSAGPRCDGYSKKILSSQVGELGLLRHRRHIMPIIFSNRIAPTICGIPILPRSVYSGSGSRSRRSWTGTRASC